MKLIRRILVAIKDTGARTQPAAEKSAALAQRLGASLELFHAVAESTYFDISGREFAEIREQRQDWHLGRLQTMASRLCDVGLPVSAYVVWDFPAHEAIIRRAIATKADLIMMDSPVRSRWAHWLLHLTDWELLRMSPVPVLLVKTRELYERPLVLAAVDPMHAHAKPARLDDAVLRYGNHLARSLSGSLHVVHARPPLSLDVAPSDIVSDPQAGVLDSRLEFKAHAEFAKWTKKARIPRARQHFVNGTPAEVLPGTARILGADLVVMGAVSRSALRRLFIGSTAERVLGDLHTDVLVVRPAPPTSRTRQPKRQRASPRYIESVM